MTYRCPRGLTDPAGPLAHRRTSHCFGLCCHGRDGAARQLDHAWTEPHSTELFSGGDLVWRSPRVCGHAHTLLALRNTNVAHSEMAGFCGCPGTLMQLNVCHAPSVSTSYLRTCVLIVCLVCEGCALSRLCVCTSCGTQYLACASCASCASCVCLCVRACVPVCVCVVCGWGRLTVSYVAIGGALLSVVGSLFIVLTYFVLPDLWKRKRIYGMRLVM